MAGSMFGQDSTEADVFLPEPDPTPASAGKAYGERCFEAEVAVEGLA